MLWNAVECCGMLPPPKLPRRESSEDTWLGWVACPFRSLARSGPGWILVTSTLVIWRPSRFGMQAFWTGGDHLYTGYIWLPNQWTRMVWKTWRFSPINRYLCSCPCAKQPGPRKPGGPSGPAKYDQFLTHSGNAKNHVFSARKNHEKPLWHYDSSIPNGLEVSFCTVKNPKVDQLPTKKAHLPFPAIRFASHRRSHVLVEPDTVFFQKTATWFPQKKNIFQVSSMKSTKSTLRYFEMMRSFTRPIDPSHPRPAACLWRERTNPGDLGSKPEKIPIITPIPLLYCMLVLHIYIYNIIYIYIQCIHIYIYHLYIYLLYMYFHTYTYCIYLLYILYVSFTYII